MIRTIALYLYAVGLVLPPVAVVAGAGDAGDSPSPGVPKSETGGVIARL